MDQIDPLLKLRLQSYVRTDNFEPQFNYICSDVGTNYFCEKPLTLPIDHFRKRDMFPNLTFDWNNLFVDV